MHNVSHFEANFSSQFLILFRFLDLLDVLCKKSALALVDGTIPWDMHRPLEDGCTLQLLNFTVAEPYLVNRYYTSATSTIDIAIIDFSFNFQYILAILFVYVGRSAIESI